MSTPACTLTHVTPAYPVSDGQDRNGVGCVIIMVVVLGVLLDVLVRISNYRNGTEYRTGQILKDLMSFLWKESLEKAKQQYNSQRNS